MAVTVVEAIDTANIPSAVESRPVKAVAIKANAAAIAARPAPLRVFISQGLFMFNNLLSPNALSLWVGSENGY